MKDCSDLHDSTENYFVLYHAASTAIAVFASKNGLTHHIRQHHPKQPVTDETCALWTSLRVVHSTICSSRKCNATQSQQREAPIVLD